MSTNGTINEILSQLLDHSISRRSFIKALGAIGVSTAGISSMLKSAEAVEKGIAPLKARSFTGTGGQLIVEQMKAAGVKYLFTNPGSFEVGFFDAFLDQPMQPILCTERVSGSPSFFSFLLNSVSQKGISLSCSL